MGQTTNMSYDADGHVVSATFSDSTPARSYSYDPDGRAVAVGLGPESGAKDICGFPAYDPDPIHGPFRTVENRRVTLTRFMDRSELWKIGALTLTRFMDRSELWKIGAWGSILPTARTRLALC